MEARGGRTSVDWVRERDARRRRGVRSSAVAMIPTASVSKVQGLGQALRRAAKTTIDAASSSLNLSVLMTRS